jgi:hypothetical protein
LRTFLIAILVLGAAGCDGGEDTDPGTQAGVCPECSLMRDECVPVGACTYEGSGFQDPGSRDCWENGVVQEHDAVTTVTLDGEPCHSWERNGFSTTFRTPEGEVAGTMTFDLATQSVTIECDGESYTVGPEDDCPSWYPDGVSCQPGSCPAP